MAKHRPWNTVEDLQLCSLYGAQVPVAEIAASLGRSAEAVTKRARALGCWKRHPNAIIRSRYFQQITTADQAYFLGLLAADGSIDRRESRYTICLALKHSDRGLVERFRDIVAPGAVLGIDRHLVRLRIGCKEMVADLATYGIVPRKSYSLTWPQNLPQEQTAPFLLGYFDGDGCLSRHTSGRLQWSLLGCEAFLWSAREHIERLAKVAASFPAQSDPRVPHLFRIDAMDAKAMAIDRVLNASGLGLPRKHLASPAPATISANG